MGTIRSDFMIPNGTEQDGSTHYDQGKFKTDGDLVEPYLYSKPTNPEDIVSTDNIQSMVAKLDRKTDFISVLMRNTTYAVGDVLYTSKLPSYLRLECVVAGTTGTTEPDFSTSTLAGQYVTDGTAVFLVCDIRDGAQVGDIKMSPVLRKGYVKANGALLTSARTNYPRLITFLNENPSLNAADDTAWNSNKALYVYNSSANTLRVPDATGRVLQGGASVASVEAGLPNVTGILATLVWKRSSTVIEATGCFAASTMGNYHIGLNSGAPVDKYVDATPNMNASRSNSLYGSSTTVQPPALSLIPQIKY